MLIATRTPGLGGIPSVYPRPLTASQSRDLLERRGLTPTGLEAAVRDAAGNPLALVELATFEDGRFEPGRSTLEEAYAAMVETLPEPCRGALLLLATCQSEGAAVIGRAMAAQGLSDEAFAPAEHAGLIRVEPVGSASATR